MYKLQAPSYLSNREQEILQLISDEYSSKAIAKELHISTHTVLTHRKNLLKKLGAQNTAGLVRRGFELNILTLSYVQH